MKYTWTRRIELYGNLLDVKFEYWPATWDTRFQPGDPAEINILTIADANGNAVPVPEIEDNGGNGDAEKIHHLLFETIMEESIAMETVMTVEPWDWIMTPSKKYTKLLHAIWVVAAIHWFVTISYFFYGMALTSGYPLLFGRISQLCFAIGMFVLILSPIYFAWAFKHRHAIGITICTLLTIWLPFFFPVWLFWAFLPIPQKIS